MLKAIFYQGELNPESAKGFLRIEHSSKGEFDDLILKYWASSEYAFAMDHYHKLNISVFDLRKPILVEIHFNGELRLELIQVAITKDRILRKGFDFPYKLKNRRFLLIPRSEYIAPKKFVLEQKPFDFVRDERLFNTIAYLANGPAKYANPLLYTPMRD